MHQRTFERPKGIYFLLGLMFEKAIEMERNGVKVIEAKSGEMWYSWLQENHDQQSSVWLIIYHKESGISSVYYPEAVDMALCFGWVDSKPNKRDDESYYQYFSKRNPKSNWSKVNKEKIQRLIDQGLMAEPGLEMVRMAKRTGTWDALNDVENLVIPPDLKEALALNPNATEYFEAFPKSVKRGILEWIFNAKRPATRAKRIKETATLAAGNKRANQYR